MVVAIVVTPAAVRAVAVAAVGGGGSERVEVTE